MKILLLNLHSLYTQKITMRHLITLTMLALTMLLLPATGHSQIVSISNDDVNSDSIREAFDRGPYFGLYKDNYFIFGCPVGQGIRRDNTNIKFQISIAQRLTRSTLPFGTYLFLFYSQKCFWNVLENSMPCMHTREV